MVDVRDGTPIRRGWSVAQGGGPGVRSVAAGDVGYLPAIGILRVTAAFAVVALHVISLWLRGTASGTAAWWVADFYDAATRWGVPVFLMISGALLLNPQRQQTPGVFYRKRMGRIFFPLMFWSVFYLGLRAVTEGISGAVIVRDLVRGSPYGHLWYLYVLAGLYGVTPLLQPFVRCASRRELAWTVVLLLIAVSLHSLVNTFTGGAGRPTVCSRFIAYIPYYLCGYLLSQLVVPHRWIKPLALGVLSVWVAIALGTGLLFPHVEFYLSSHHSPLTILLSVGVFLLAWGLCAPEGTGRTHSWGVLRYVDGTSFGVYLIHPFLLCIAMKSGLPSADMLAHPLLWIPVGSVVLATASILLTVCLKSVPVLCRVV